MNAHPTERPELLHVVEVRGIDGWRLWAHYSDAERAHEAHARLSKHFGSSEVRLRPAPSSEAP